MLLFTKIYLLKPIILLGFHHLELEREDNVAIGYSSFLAECSETYSLILNRYHFAAKLSLILLLATKQVVRSNSLVHVPILLEQEIKILLKFFF